MYNFLRELLYRYNKYIFYACPIQTGQYTEYKHIYRIFENKWVPAKVILKT